MGRCAFFNFKELTERVLILQMDLLLSLGLPGTYEVQSNFGGNILFRGTLFDPLVNGDNGVKGTIPY